MAEHAHNTYHATVITSRRIAVATALLALSCTAGAAELPAGAKFHPDAELLAASAEFNERERKWQVLLRVDEARAAALDDAQHELQNTAMERMCTLPCTTRDGMAALAATLTVWDADLRYEEDDPDAPADERLVAALVRNLLGTA